MPLKQECFGQFPFVKLDFEQINFAIDFLLLKFNGDHSIDRSFNSNLFPMLFLEDLTEEGNFK